VGKPAKQIYRPHNNKPTTTYTIENGLTKKKKKTNGIYLSISD